MSREIAFSNGTQYEIWAANWCDRCLRDAIFRNTGKGSGCKILCGVMATNEVPAEWLVQDEIHEPATCEDCGETFPSSHAKGGHRRHKHPKAQAS